MELQEESQLSTRRKMWLELKPAARTFGVSRTNKIVVALIGLSVIVEILRTEPLIYDNREWIFHSIEGTLTLIFGIEYLSRVYAAGEENRYRGLLGRLRYMITFSSLLDLSSLVLSITTFAVDSAFILRLARLLRIMRIARLGRFSRSLDFLVEALKPRIPDLFICTFFALILLVFTSIVLYLVESGIQPEAFGSIPRAMWWAVATLTTVGYGDVYPLTVTGKIFGAMTALIGVGLVAMPAGIFAAALSDALERRRNEHRSK